MTGAPPSDRATRAAHQAPTGLDHSAGIAGEFDLPVNYDQLEWRERKAVREQYIREQRGKCQHCGGRLDEPPIGKEASLWINARLFPSSFFKHPVHLHHCHRTGMTIGAVHNRCNAVLWQYHGQ